MTIAQKAQMIIIISLRPLKTNKIMFRYRKLNLDELNELKGVYFESTQTINRGCDNILKRCMKFSHSLLSTPMT